MKKLASQVWPSRVLYALSAIGFGSSMVIPGLRGAVLMGYGVVAFSLGVWTELRDRRAAPKEEPDD